MQDSLLPSKEPLVEEGRWLMTRIWMRFIEGIKNNRIFGGSTDYTEFSSTGHQTMAGEAKCWNDVRIEPVARTTGTNAPAFEQWYTNGSGSRGVYLYSFDDSSSEKEVFFTLQMPHDWDQGGILLHVHWVGAVDDTSAAPKWGLEFNWKEPGEVYGNSNIIYSTTNVQGDTDIVAHKHYISSFVVQSPSASQDGLSSILIGRLFRNSGDAGDTYNASGAKCGLLYIDAHYQMNSIGSNSEYVK